MAPEKPTEQTPTTAPSSIPNPVTNQEPASVQPAANVAPADNQQPTVIEPNPTNVEPPVVTPSPPTLAPNNQNEVKMPWDEPGANTANPETAGPIVNPASADQNENAWNDQSQKSPRKIKKNLLIVGGSLATVLLIGGFVFGYYIPNKPQNVFKTGLNRTGFVVNVVANQATKKENINKIEKTALKASLTGKSDTVTVKASIDTKFDATKAVASVKGSLQEKGQPDKNIAFNAISDTPKNSALPNLFIQAIGLKTLKANSIYPGIEDYEGKWITIDKTVWDQLGITQETMNSSKAVTNEEIAQSTKALVSVTSEYLLNADKSKAVLENRKFVAKEKVDGVTAHHYIVGINQTNAKAYCQKLVTTALDTPVYSKLTGSKQSDIDTIKKNSAKTCSDTVNNNFKAEDTFDLWVNSSSKLIHKIRIKDKTNPKNYTEIGQIFKGRDQVTIFLNDYQDADQSRFSIRLTTSVKTNKTSGEITYSNKNKVTFKADVESMPYTGNIDVKAPAGAIPSSEILKKITDQMTSQAIADANATAAANNDSGASDTNSDNSDVTIIDVPDTIDEEN